MPQVTGEQVLDALRVVLDPDLGRDIVSLGFVKDVTVQGGAVAFRIELTTPACPVKDMLKGQAHEVVSAVPGVASVEVEMTAQVRAQKRTGPMIPGVKHVIAVASGKGGVGKSTVACNLAIALREAGASVGLLDADIYGPSIPMMMGAEEGPEVEGETIIPVDCWGVKTMSIGYFVEEGKAVIWRGPMIAKFLEQVFTDVRWGELDYLVVDLPPGTGDAPLSLTQLIPITGVVIVMTPQDVAMEIATKSIIMFQMMEETLQRPIPILGIIENMSGFVCPNCGELSQVFGMGGGEAAAARMGLAFLGAIPIDPAITISGDVGRPAILSAPDSRTAAAFRAIAGHVAARASTVTLAEREERTGA